MSESVHPSNVKHGLRPLFVLEADVGAMTSIGETPLGEIRLVSILGGKFSGEELSGKVLPGGADWQQVRSDGTLEIRAKYLLQTDRDELLQVQSEGLRAASPEVLARIARGERVEPTDYYFRTALRFTTSAPRLLRLNDILGVSYGRRAARSVVLEFFELL